MFKVVEPKENEDTSETKSSDSEFKKSVATEYLDVKMELFDRLPQFDRENVKISKIIDIIPKMLFDAKRLKISVSILIYIFSNQKIVMSIYQLLLYILQMTMLMYTELDFYIMKT